MSAQGAGRSFGLLLYWVRRNGVCVITEGAKPALVFVSPEHYDALAKGLGATIAVAAERARNPKGVFTLADKVFGTGALADWWMMLGNERLAGKRPVDMLGTQEEVKEVKNILRRIQRGMFA